jgi:hypothetical protein
MSGSRKNYPHAAHGSRGCAVPTDPTRSREALRLRAEDGEDLAVISACLQDALVAVSDLAYDRDARTFVLVANRFRWEDSRPAGSAPFERTFCAIVFDEIDGVTYRGFQRGEENRILELLAIQPTPRPPGATIDLEFAGAATIRLRAQAIRCRAGDLGEPWPTVWQPGHELDGP